MNANLDIFQKQRYQGTYVQPRKSTIELPDEWKSMDAQEPFNKMNKKQRK